MGISRRDFIRGTSAVAVSGAIVNQLGSKVRADDVQSGVGSSGTSSPMIWANLLHLGQNMWGDTDRAYTPKTSTFNCDESLWIDVTEKSAAVGMNMIIIDIGEAIQYKSHPELAVKGAWSIDKLRQDLDRLRKLGLEPIPKLNFSTCHDIWLGDYSRMISTPTYYKVCEEIIQEVCEIFDSPRFFHLGYDEENFGNQTTFDYVVIRQGELWWHDFLFFVKTVEKNNVRPWIWSDFCWHHKEEFLQRMPHSVLQSNWYYGAGFDPEKSTHVQTYIDLDKAGFDQVPAGSNWSCDVNFQGTVEFCKANVSPALLKGFMMAPWRFTLAKDKQKHYDAIAQVRAAKETFEK